MDRRRFFTGIASAALFGGCVGGSSGTGVPRTVSVKQIEREPREYGVTLQATVTEADVTTSQTASVEVRFTNTSEESTPDIGIDTRYPDPLWSIDENYTRAPGSILVPETYSPQPERASNTCWEPTENFEFAGPGIAESTTLDPGEQLTRTYSVWGDTATEGCMPPGEYRFGVRNNRPDPPMEWTFTLLIEDEPF